MYVYRVMSSTELVNRLNGIETNKAAVKGVNTFKYEEGMDYIHFYKFAEHAFINMDKFGCVVAKIKLDDNIVPPLEYGFYSGIKTYYDDSLFFYDFPVPEIIINRSQFNNKAIMGFASKLTGNFTRYEDGSYPLEFWVDKYIPFQGKEMQMWNMHSIYYEYIKSLLPKYGYNEYAVVRYLKTIDLDKALIQMADEIKKKKLIIKKKKTK